MAQTEHLTIIKKRRALAGAVKQRLASLFSACHSRLVNYPRWYLALKLNSAGLGMR